MGEPSYAVNDKFYQNLIVATVTKSNKDFLSWSYLSNLSNQDTCLRKQSKNCKNVNNISAVHVVLILNHIRYTQIDI